MPTLDDRVEMLKSGKHRKFYEISLRDDLSRLMEAGLRREGITQRELARRAGFKSESYISRVINAATNFKIGVAARVLVPLGIIPILVDKAEWDALKHSGAQKQAGTRPQTRRGDNGTNQFETRGRIAGDTTPGSWRGGTVHGPAATCAQSTS